MQILLPFKYFEEINNRQWFDKFFESISDSSESGPVISESEFGKLKDEKGGVNLVHRWNATVIEWSITPSLFSEANFSGMKFTDARELIIHSDRLKTLTRQYSDDNPFALLHNYMGRLLSGSSENKSGSQQALKFENTDEDICAYAYSLITPERPYENSEFQITLRVINKKKEPLEFVKVKLEMIQSRDDTALPPMQFRIGPVMLDGIGSIDRASKLLPNASFVAKWSLKPVKNMRLIREVEYQAILIVKFVRGGLRNIQRIATQTVIFCPRPSLKIYYFISNLMRSQNAKSMNTSLPMLNVIIALMNTGYSHLKNVKAEEIRISVLSEDNVKKFIPYQISGIITSSGVEDRVLSDLRFSIANIESGKTRGVIRDFKVTTSVNGELIELEDTQTFIIHQFISPTKFLVSLQTNPALLFYYDMQKSVLRTISPLIFINVNEKSGTSDGKPFRQQIASFQLNESQQQPTSFYAQIPYPDDLEHDFDVLRVNQIGKNGVLKLVDPRYVWNSNTDKKFVHFIDDNPSVKSESIEYEIIYGNAEIFLRPRFEFFAYNIPLVTANWPHVGDDVAHIMATSASQSAIRYELYSNSSKMDDYFTINPETASSFSSSSSSIIIDEAETSISDEYPVTPLVIMKHGYTKLIATQSISNLTFGSSSLLQSSPTAVSESSSKAGSEPSLSNGSDLSIVSSTSSTDDTAENDLDASKSVNFPTDTWYKTRKIESTKEGTVSSRGEIYGESDRTNERGITWGDSYSSGNGYEGTFDERKSKLWQSTSRRSIVSSTNTIDLYSTMGQFSISSESGISTVSSTYINDNTDNSFETTDESNISLLTEKNVSNAGSKEVPQLYLLFSTKAPTEKATLIHTTVPPSHQHIASIYNFSTANTIYFYSSSSNLEAESPSSEYDAKSVITDANDGPKNDQSQKSSLQRSTYYSLTSSTPQITEFSGASNAEVSNIQIATKIPVTISFDETSVDYQDKENISEMACRMRDKQPIWSLICDLSETSKIQKLLKIRSKSDFQEKN
ncbi:unnamed protein product [Onchocerca flexuosa]|uniref:Uncharacterized protein n=1 Tax=Onchocerca flexuosa TaxID=387005 RepID=A0A3P7UXX4_9BILA|nr:unnamed protein product [Onchocerca flexuosa]